MMDKLDKMLREHSSSMDVPEHYKVRIEETLKNLPEDAAEETRGKKRFAGAKKFGLVAAAAVLLIVAVAFVDMKADANIFESFRQTITRFLGISPEEKKELGVDSTKQSESSKADLMIELTERIVDRSSIYVMLKVTAPKNIELNDKVAFDYYAFSKGENYNTDKLIPGATGFKLSGVNPDKKNEATFIMQISSDKKIKDGSMVTAYMKDLMLDPNGDGRKMLVEGMWSVTFEADYTVKKNIEIKGTADMSYPFMKKKAYVKKIEITPLGMSVRSDVSAVPADVMNVSDTSHRIRLKMIDGSEMLLMSHDLDEKVEVQTGSEAFSNKGKKTYQTVKLEFRKTLNIARILGVYIEDLYIPVLQADKDSSEGTASGEAVSSSGAE